MKPPADEAKRTHFGFQSVAEEEKARHVGAVFSSVAQRYDLMNDLMSWGLHRLWKRFAVEVCGLRPGQRVLDVAGGTGDLARRLWPKVMPGGGVVLSDINASMLERGRDRLLDEGTTVPAVRCDAERLPFAGDCFDCVTIGFGLRNVTRKDAALAESFRVLRAGGRLVVLEFSHVPRALGPLYDAYSFGVLPLLGRVVAKDAASYRYLAESIRVHPSQRELAAMLAAAGFERVEYFNLAGGVVAVHRGFKLG
ncbi:MAG: class I SAM-dependent methyltransferase [Burkholderiales bacterium]|nr:class I SAM-dependent methyltransferase [Burkholderiales bacterium]